MRIREVMRTNVRTIKPSEPVSMAKELFRRYDIHHLVVVDKGVAGVVNDHDFAGARDDDPVERIMSRHVVTIGPEETIRKAAAIMTGQGIGSLPVVDDEKLVGIVTTRDLLLLIAKGAVHPAPNAERPVLAKRAPRRKPLMAR